MAELTVGYLLGEHREIEMWLERLQTVLESGRVSPHAADCLAPCPKCITEAIASRIERLIQAEEEVLFPALAQFLPADIGPLAVLRGEYVRIQQHLRWLLVAADSLNRGGVSMPVQWESFQSAGRETRQAICDQIYKKDRVLFPLVTRWLSPQQDEALRRQMEALHCHGSVTHAHPCRSASSAARKTASTASDSGS